MTKRGVISLPVNGIIIITIALVMLALLIVFVVGSFRTTSGNFMSQARQATLPEAVDVRPIVYEIEGGREVSPGDDFVVRVSVYNKGAASLDSAVWLLCDADLFGGSVSTMVKDIPERKAVSFTVLTQISTTATKGLHVCELKAKGFAGTTDIASTDLVVSVK